jgi:hypothetical protein
LRQRWSIARVAMSIGSASCPGEASVIAVPPRTGAAFEAVIS